MAARCDLCEYSSVICVTKSLARIRVPQGVVRNPEPAQEPGFSKAGTRNPPRNPSPYTSRTRNPAGKNPSQIVSRESLG